eukprot:2823980-Rhodomonas_salina.1
MFLCLIRARTRGDDEEATKGTACILPVLREEEYEEEEKEREDRREGVGGEGEGEGEGEREEA